MITIHHEAFCCKMERRRRERGGKSHNFEELHSLGQVEEVLGNDLVHPPEGLHFPVPGRLRVVAPVEVGAEQHLAHLLRDPVRQHGVEAGLDVLQDV